MSNGKLDGTFIDNVYVDGRVNSIITAEKAANNGIALLDGAGKIVTTQLPPLAITETYVVADIAERNTLNVQEGDVAIVTDTGAGESNSYIMNDSSVWLELKAPSHSSHINSTANPHSVTAAQINAVAYPGAGTSGDVLTSTGGAGTQWLTPAAGSVVASAFIQFNGGTANPTVLRGNNISSVTYVYTGVWEVTFTNAMPDALYSFSGDRWVMGATNYALQEHGHATYRLRTTTKLRFATTAGSSTHNWGNPGAGEKGSIIFVY